MDENEDTDTALRGFRWVIGVAAVVGAALAFLATTEWLLPNFFNLPLVNPSTPSHDALREIGGAIVAGAVLAYLVVWFEERREAARVDREVRREKRREDRADDREANRDQRATERQDEADRRSEARDERSAKYAFQREIDLLLQRLIRVQLPPARRAWLDEYGVTRYLDSEIPADLVWSVRLEIRTMLDPSGRHPLTVPFRAWSIASSDLIGALRQLDSRRPPPEDLVQGEERAFENLLSACTAYIDQRYFGDTNKEDPRPEAGVEE